MLKVGIDTGGTCTDAVIIDTESLKVISQNKTLTTKYDLKVGIINALRGLDQSMLRKAESISLSTTLATNACVEDKGGRAKLVFIGVNPKSVERMSDYYGLPKCGEIYFLDGDASIDGSKPDWSTFREDVKNEFWQYDSIAIVQINPMYNDGYFEKLAEEIILEELKIDCIRGFDLYQEINVQKRGATALLNAKLMPVLKNFIESINKSIEALDLQLPIHIVKSDSSIMREEYALFRPVETLLCGPAACVEGALNLSNKKDAIVVDMGGTTSDVSIIKAGEPYRDYDGVTVGKWNTLVKGVAIDTFALGGDSAVTVDNLEIKLLDRRIVPISMLGAQFPCVIDKLKDLINFTNISSASKNLNSKNKAMRQFFYLANEFFLIQHIPKNLDRYSKTEKAIIEALKSGPLNCDMLAESVNLSPYTLDTKRLEDEDIIIKSGFTPTDAMHILGDYTEYSVEAARLSLKYIENIIGISTEQICEKIYSLVKIKMFYNLACIMMKYDLKKELTGEQKILIQSIAENTLSKKDFLKCLANIRIEGKLDIIGIGASAHIFLNDVAKAFSVDGDFPKYGKVANAIGAALGRFYCEAIVLIQPNNINRSKGEYKVLGATEIKYFFNYKEALIEAKKIACEKAKFIAIEAGAAGEFTYKTKVNEDFFSVRNNSSKLLVETRVSVSVESEFLG